MLGQLGGKVKFCPTFGVVDPVFGVMDKIFGVMDQMFGVVDQIFGVMDQIFVVVEQIPFFILKFQLTSLEELDARTIRIPYVGGRVVMDIILPNQK